MKNKKKDNLLQVVDTKDIQLAQDSGPMAQVTMFLNAGGKIEDMKAIMDLQDRDDAKKAKNAFTKAMSDFKSAPLSIVKDKTNTQFGSRYVSIGQLVNAVLPSMGKYGLSHKWVTEQPDPKLVRVTCTITHADGHSESTSMSAPPDTSGGNSKNPIQQIKSTRTYLQAATFEDIMGLASTNANVDDDGNSSSSAKLISEKQVSILTDMMNEYVKDEDDFLNYVGVESIDKLPVKRFNAVKTDLEALKK